MLCTIPLQTAVAAKTSSDDTGARRAEAEEAPARLYRTREEQREAGLHRQITSWLTTATLFEGEATLEDGSAWPNGKNTGGFRETIVNLQVEILVTPTPLLSTELLLEFDSESLQPAVDEAVFSLEDGAWELSLGRQYTPFGVYFSAFMSSPLLEFAETRADEIVAVSFEPNDDAEYVLALYRGTAKEVGGEGGSWDWAFGAELWPYKNLSLGLSYQSDLADSDAGLLHDAGDRYRRRVGGLSGYALWASERLELSLEFVAALDSFAELAPDRNRPYAWNAELAHFFPASSFEVAFRLEGSAEIRQAPRSRYGMAITWRTASHATLTLEYLRSEFQDPGGTGNGDSPRYVNRYGAIFSFAF